MEDSPDRKSTSILYWDHERVVLQLGGGESQVYPFAQWEKRERKLRERGCILRFPEPESR